MRNVGHEVRMSGQQLPQQRLVRDRLQVLGCPTVTAAAAAVAAATAGSHGFEDLSSSSLTLGTTDCGRIFLLLYTSKCLRHFNRTVFQADRHLCQS